MFVTEHYYNIYIIVLLNFIVSITNGAGNLTTCLSTLQKGPQSFYQLITLDAGSISPGAWYFRINFYSLNMAKFKATFLHLSAKWKKFGVTWDSSSNDIVCQVSAFPPQSRKFLHVSWSKQGARLIPLLSFPPLILKPDIVNTVK